MYRFMKVASKNCRPISITLSLVAVVVVLGCGGDDSGLGRRYKVTGKVTYKGAPLEKGTMNFLPSKPLPPEGRAASGEIKNGVYSLSTTGNDDGALPGEYKVAIVALDIDMASAASSKAEGGRIHEGDAKYQAAIKNAKRLIPSKYTTGETSGLTANVGSGPNEINFDLTD